ncbi:hypothetical protein OEZ85_009914 [Tetradesmus obliquus]|uniref:Cyclin N-terminal domain-containing protein n=1 Tax=Tetradesmus obliquus TaxID=3088 RepID=A0ABY8UDA7_TETOB|nr:hypothetical protein OEZ85_009914 [Tetradesmus obliquus]
MRARLLITELAVYSSTSKPLVQAMPWLRNVAPPISCGCSAADLSLSNRLMSGIKLPGSIQYVPVESSSRIFAAGASWRLPAFVVCLASSYLQRVVAQDTLLAAAAGICSGFEAYHYSLPRKLQRRFPSHTSAAEQAAAIQRLRSVKCTCLYLALKVADSVHARGLLAYMLGQVTGVRPAAAEAAALEGWVLQQLGWRLGPFFAEQEDAEWAETGEGKVWAQAVGTCWDCE